MEIDDEILINKFAQNLILINKLKNDFDLLDLRHKLQNLDYILFMIMQSNPVDDDILPAIFHSGLKSTSTPCVLLQKGVANHNLRKLIELPENEIGKSFVLLLNLFKLAYLRKFGKEKNRADKWWYWDLSNEENVKKIKLINK